MLRLEMLSPSESKSWPIRLWPDLTNLSYNSLMATMTKRAYNRRTSEQIIADLEAQIALQREKIEAKTKANDPVLKEIPKVRRQLRKFAQLAADGSRTDISNSVTAFITSLERMYKKS